MNWERILGAMGISWLQRKCEKSGGIVCVIAGVLIGIAGGVAGSEYVGPQTGVGVHDAGCVSGSECK